MSLSSSPVSLSNDASTPRSRDDLRASTVEEIVAAIDIPALFGDGRSPVNVGEVERGLKDLMSDACRAVMGQYIEGLDDGRPTLLRDGEIWTRVPKTHNTIMTLFGPVTYVRHRYRRADSPSLVPVDEQLGLAMDYFTEPAGELAVLLYSQLPARTCSDLCRRIGGMALTESTLQRLARGPSKRGTRFRRTRSRRSVTRKASRRVRSVPRFRLTVSWFRCVRKETVP